MSKFVVIVFPSEAQAYEGTRVLKELHAEGSLTLYGMAVIAKDAEANVSIKESADAGPLGTAVGALVGGLVGVIGGPVGALAGVTAGGLVGSIADLLNYGVGADFVARISKLLAPGRSAIIAEIAETWTTPLDTRMVSLGGTILRTWRADFEDEQIAVEIAARRADLKQLQAEYAQASANAEASLKAMLEKEKADLDEAQKRLKSRLDALQKEVSAKVAALEKQITNAKADAREKIKQRIAAVRADHEARSAKLKQAWTLTKEALAA
jgi:uncharacterized membrane protein